MVAKAWVRCRSSAAWVPDYTFRVMRVLHYDASQHCVRVYDILNSWSNSSLEPNELKKECVVVYLQHFRAYLLKRLKLHIANIRSIRHIVKCFKSADHIQQYDDDLRAHIMQRTESYALDNADATATTINECLLQSPILANLNGDVTRLIFEEWLGPVQSDRISNDMIGYEHIKPVLKRKIAWETERPMYCFETKLTFYNVIQLQRPRVCEKHVFPEIIKNMCSHVAWDYDDTDLYNFYETQCH